MPPLQAHEIVKADSVRELIVSDVFPNGDVLVSLADLEVSFAPLDVRPCLVRPAGHICSGLPC